MTPIGAFILFMCFVGPILPPIIGTIVGGIYDSVKARQPEGLEAHTRRLSAERHAATQFSQSSHGSVTAERLVV